MSSPVKKVLVTLSLTLALLVALVVAAAAQLMRDTSSLESYLSGLLQRRVDIGSISELNLGRQPTIVVEQLNIANPAWAQQPYLLQLQKARVRLDLFSLWGEGPIVIRNLEVYDLQVALEDSAEHGSSWGFAGAEEEGFVSDGALQLPLVLEQAHISNSNVSYRDAASQLAAKLSGQIRGGAGLALEIDGHWNTAPVAFSGRTARDGEGMTLSGEGSYQEWQLELSGNLDDPLRFRGLDFQLSLAGKLPFQAEHEDLLRELPLALQIRITGSGSRLDVSQGLLTSGDSQLTLNGTLGNPATLKGLALELVLDSPDIKKILPVSSVNAEPVPVALEGRLVSDGQVLSLEKFSGRSGGARFWTDLEIPIGGGANGATLSGHARGDSAAALLSPWLNEVPADAPFEIDVNGVWEPPLIRLEELELRLAKNKLNADLTVTMDEQGPALAGRIHLSGKRAYQSLAALGFTAQLPDESYMLKSDIAVAADGSFSLEGLDAQLGRSDLAGSLQYQPGAPGKLNATLHARKLDIRFLAEAFDKQLVQDTDVSSSSGQLESNMPLTRAQLDARLIPETPLQLDWLSDIEGRLAVAVDEVIARRDLRSRGEFVFRLADNRLVSEKMAWDGDFSSGDATLELENLSPGVRLNLQLQSHRLPLFWILTGNPQAEQESDYRVAITGSGATVRELAGSLDGNIIIRGGGGQVNNRGLDLFFGDAFGEIFTRIDPSVQQKTYTEMICHAGGLEFDSGLVRINPGVVLRTEGLDIALGGGFSLRDESLNMVFNTRSRKGLGISASKAVTPYLKLGGNFSHPRLGVNAKGVVVSGGAAVLTGGLSILAEGMWDRWVATSVNPCEALFETTDESGKELKKLFGRP